MPIPNIPITNLGNLYVTGLFLEWLSVTSILVGSGQARDSTNIDDIVLQSQTTINAEKNGLNGLDTGSLVASTFYYVFVVDDSTRTKPTGCLLSLSASNPTLPAHYDMFRRIGAVLTDGAAHILEFYQSGADNCRTMWYDVLIQVLNGGTSATFAAVSLATAIPIVSTKAILQLEYTPTGAGNLANLRPTGSASTNGNVIVSGVVAGQPQYLQALEYNGIPTSLSSIDYKCVGTLSIWVCGYEDVLYF